MPSQAQIDANRRNSQKSTGPTSPEGKAASSLNALKSGIHSNSHVIPGEDPAELAAITAAFLLHHQPAGPNQLALVDTLIFAEWTQRRLRRIEAQLWVYQIECLDKTLTRDQYLDDTYKHPAPLGHAYTDALEPFTRIQRRIDSTNRMYLRTLQALQTLQKTPVGQASQPVTKAPEPQAPEETKPVATGIGFVPPIASAARQGPRISHENHQISPEAEIVETVRRGLAHQPHSQAHDS